MKEEYECEQVPVVLYIPNNTIKLQLTATVMEDDGSMPEVVDTLFPARLADARIDGDMWERDNTQWKLSENGKKLLEELKNER